MQQRAFWRLGQAAKGYKLERCPSQTKLKNIIASFQAPEPEQNTVQSDKNEDEEDRATIVVKATARKVVPTRWESKVRLYELL